MVDGELDFSDETYEKAGVSIKAQNEVNKEVAKRLKEVGFEAKGWFGGAVDVSKFKGKKNIYLNIAGTSLCSPNKNFIEAGKETAESAFFNIKGKPLGVLDYIASLDMGKFVADFVEGVARTSLEKKCAVLGGESAQMKDTYKKNKIDAFVHILTIGEDYGGCEISDLIDNMKRPLLVASTDGTGTKTKIIKNPEDVIYHGFNDIGAQGAKPIAFSLYIAGNVPMKEIYDIVENAKTISEKLGINQLDSLAVIKKDIYLYGEVDIAGTVVGIVDKKDLITGHNVKPGDVIFGIGVDGLMTNGFSLGRRLCDKLVKNGEVKSYDASVKELNGKSLRYELSRPHRYMTDILFGYDNVEGILSKFDIKGMAHITGGGQPDNIPRMVPDNCKAVIYKNVLPVPPLMQFFKDYGLTDEELDHDFNMGVGFALIVSEHNAPGVGKYVNDNFRTRIEGVDRRAAVIGRIESRKKSEPKFEFA